MYAPCSQQQASAFINKQVKPLLHIKRSNADWQTIMLHWLYQHETIQRLLDDCEREEENQNKK